MKKIAITGGIGSGKSAVLQYVKENGYRTYSCDEIYREIIVCPIYVERLARVFPEAVINGTIDKNVISRLIFQDEEKRRILNSIAHPLIMQRLEERMESCNEALVFAEVPLLFEGSYENRFDEIIVVMRGKEERIKSLQRRDGDSTSEIESKMFAQFDYYGEEADFYFKKRNVILIENCGTELELKEKVDSVILKIEGKL